MFYATALPHSSCKTILPCLFFGEKIPSCEIVLIATILLCRIHQLSHVRKEIKIQTNAGMFPNGERFVNASVSLWEVCKCTSISLWINVSVYICESRDIYVWISKHISEPLDIYLWITKYICESRFVRLNRVLFVCDSRFVCLNRVSFVCELWNKSNSILCSVVEWSLCVHLFPDQRWSCSAVSWCQQALEPIGLTRVNGKTYWGE